MEAYTLLPQRQQQLQGAAAAAAAVVAITKAVQFLASSVSKDDQVVDLRDRVLTALRRYHFPEHLITDYLTQYRLRVKDIPNIRIFAREPYRGELERLYNMTFEIIAQHFPKSEEPLIEQVQRGVDLGAAVDYALRNPKKSVVDSLDSFTDQVSDNPTVKYAVLAMGGIVFFGTLAWMLSD